MNAPIMLTPADIINIFLGACGLITATNLTMKALLALLKHSIDGNDTASMKKVRDELEEYLIDR